MSAVPDDAAAAALTAALLEQGRAVHLLSCAFTLASLGGVGIFAFGPGFLVPTLLVGAILLGALQTFLAMRVGFDAAIFRQIAAAQMDWTAVDHGLAALRLAARPDCIRSDESRRRGALRLLRRQGAAAALQGLLLLAALLAPAWLPFAT